ncbi:MAG: hypothetical protein JXP34_15050 [Planctomycetes bacterium]|nr:hypothetical protein [Planctomycetota bacterium]
MTGAGRGGTPIARAVVARAVVAKPSDLPLCVRSKPIQCAPSIGRDGFGEASGRRAGARGASGGGGSAVLFNIGKHEVAVILCALAVLFVGVPAMAGIAVMALRRSIARWKRKVRRKPGPAVGPEADVVGGARTGVRGKDRR